MADSSEIPIIPAAAVRAAAREGEYDRYLAALLAPAPARDGLLALAAFASELGRVPLLAREPMMAEIRLQWWRDALEQPAAIRTGHPLADAVREVAAHYVLSPDLLVGMIEARSREASAEPIADDAALNARLWAIEGAQFVLAANIVGNAAALDFAPAAMVAGTAYGLARTIAGFSRTLARGRSPLPQTRLDAAGLSLDALFAGEDGAKVGAILADLAGEARKSLVTARQHVANLPRGFRVAFLPLALVELYLRTVQRAGIDPVRESADLSPLARVMRIAAAHWLGRL